MADHSAKPRIEVGGTPLGPDFDVRLEQAIVDDHLFLPDMFVLRFRDPDRTLLDRAGFAIGSTVKIFVAPIGNGIADELMSGEVTSLEADFDATGSHAVVRGFDESHRLHRGRKTETYRNVTDGDIVRRVAQRAGIDVGRIDETAGVHEHVSQTNLTDWEFLKARAREIGYEIAVVSGMLEFRRPREASGAPGLGDLMSENPSQLVLGSNLEEFRPRLSSSQQVRQVEVRGWDPSRKQAVVGVAPAETSSADLRVSPADLAAKFGDPTLVAVDNPLSTQREVDAAARALAEEIAGAFAEAEAVVRGDPKLKAGSPVSVSLASPAFEGRYTVTSSRHVFDGRGYKTHLVISGRQERSLLGLTSLGATNGAGNGGGPPVFGVVVAQVTDVNDPEKLGRVKLKFPWLSDDYESNWARVVQAGAGMDRGFQIIPEVNDEVLVAFDHGDVRHPYVVGGLYNGVDTPTIPSGLIDESSGAVNYRWFQSRRGHRLHFTDTTAGGGIFLRTEDGKNRVALSNSKNRIEVHSNGDIVIEAGGSLTVKAGWDLALEAENDLTIKARKIALAGDLDVALESQATMTLQGANTAVKGTAALDVDGGALANIHAGVVKIN